MIMLMELKLIWNESRIHLKMNFRLICLDLLGCDSILLELDQHVELYFKVLVLYKNKLLSR